jgi:hypothetical protein
LLFGLITSKNGQLGVAMPPDIKESDWKTFRDLHPIAVERFAARTMAEVQRLIDEKEGTELEQYRAIYDLMIRQNKELAFLFDDYRRSTAIFQLALIRSRKLITDEEFARFSLETREKVVVLLQLGRS